MRKRESQSKNGLILNGFAFGAAGAGGVEADGTREPARRGGTPPAELRQNLSNASTTS